MLTKSDLAAIQKMFDVSRKETDVKFDAINKRFEQVDKRFDKLSEELIELISTGFRSNEVRFQKIEQKLFTAN